LPDDPARRSEIQALQERWDTMQAVRATGRWPDLLAQAQALGKDAEAVGHKPIQARAMSQALMALERLGRPDEVNALRQRTLELASEAKVYDVVAYLAVRLLLLAVDGERIGEARAMLPLVDADVRLAGRPPALEIRLLTFHAAVLTADGQFQAAGEKLELALAECRQLGPEGQRSCLTPQRELGLLHAARKDFAGARRELDAAVELAKRAYGAQHPSLLDEYNNAAHVMIRAGDLDAAARALAESKALAARLPESRQTASIPQLEGMILKGRGDPLAALPFLEQAERRSSAVHGEQTIQSSAGKLLLGQCLTSLGRSEAALPYLERALELRRTLQAPPRSVAEASSGLAEALWNTPGGRRRAVELAQQALALYRDEGQMVADEARSVQAWLDAHPASLRE
jgi:tetratricopeptide (TPR) repeat protein